MKHTIGIFKSVYFRMKFAALFTTCFGLFLLSCGQLDRESLLNGDFGKVDTSAPKIIAPQNGSIEKNLQATLIWSRMDGAMAYTVQVSTDQDFNSQISGSPFLINPQNNQLKTSLTLSSSVLQEGVYYWRVRSDKTPKGQYSVSSFIVLDDALYLYCPSSETNCVETNDANGTREEPYRTFTRAMNQAKRFGLNVKVAQRGAGAMYNEIIIPVSGVKLYGGYTAGDWSRNVSAYETKITSDFENIIFAENFGSDATFEMDGFTLEKTSNSNVTAVSLKNSGTIDFNNVKITVNATNSKVIGIKATDTSLNLHSVNMNLNGMIYVDGLIASGGSHSYQSLTISLTKNHATYWETNGVQIDNCTNAVIKDSNISNPGVDSYLSNNWDAFALRINGCNAEITGNTFNMGPDADVETANSHPVKVTGAGEIYFNNNQLSLSHAETIDLSASTAITMDSNTGSRDTVLNAPTLTVRNNQVRSVSVTNFTAATMTGNQTTGGGYTISNGNSLTFSSNQTTGSVSNGLIITATSGTIEANTFDSSTAGASRGIDAQNPSGKSLTIQDNTITGFRTGIYSEDYAFTIHNNTITARPNTNTYALHLLSTSGAITGNTLNSFASVSGLCYSIRMENSSTSSTTIARNRIDSGGCSSASIGIRLADHNLVSVVNNLIAVRSGGEEHGIYRARGLIANNTIYFRNTNGSNSSAIHTDTASTQARIYNNILFAEGTGPRIGIFESAAAASPMAVKNNNFFGFSTIYTDEAATAVTDLITAVSTGEGSATLASYDNVSVDNSGDQLFENIAGADTFIYTLADNNWNLKSTAPATVRTGGLNGSSSASNFGFTIDFSETSRSPLDATPTGWSMGAYEQ